MTAPTDRADAETVYLTPEQTLRFVKEGRQLDLIDAIDATRAVEE